VYAVAKGSYAHGEISLDRVRLKLAPSSGPHRAGDLDPTPGDGNRFSFRNVVSFRITHDEQSQEACQSREIILFATRIVANF
jgi:hypothetical protein